MPIQLSQLKANTRTVVVAYYDDTVTVRYQPSVLTPNREAAIKAAASDNDNTAMLEAISEMVLEWDVLGDEGKPLPRTVDVLRELPNAFLTAIFQSIGEDMAPKARSARSSFAR